MLLKAKIMVLNHLSPAGSYNMTKGKISSKSFSLALFNIAPNLQAEMKGYKNGLYTGPFSGIV